MSNVTECYRIVEKRKDGDIIVCYCAFSAKKSTQQSNNKKASAIGARAHTPPVTSACIIVIIEKEEAQCPFCGYAHRASKSIVDAKMRANEC